MLNKDYSEILQILSDHDVKFLVVGAYAMGAYGYVRATGDIDVWVMASADNSEKTYNALKVFGAPLSQIDNGSFKQPGVVFQIGVAPRRIDILTRIDGIQFDQAYEKRNVIEVDGLKIPFISLKDLVTNKLATGRPKDKLDADQLSKLD
jgi:predicted nucleotidyltransferase